MRKTAVSMIVPTALVLLGLASAPAEGQWYVASFTGANHTRAAAVSIDQPGLGRALTFDGVAFDAEPFTSPQYYGARIGWLLSGRRLGIEAEFLHVKAIAVTSDPVRVTGTTAGTAVDATVPMDRFVQRYAMTHGLNFWMANLVWRTPLGRSSASPAWSAVLRAGLGPVVPGVDSVVDNVSVQGYQYAGLGGQVAAGVDVRLYRRLSATAEYKLTRARPTLDIAEGSGRTTTLTHHVAFGIAFGFSGG